MLLLSYYLILFILLYLFYFSINNWYDSHRCVLCVFLILFVVCLVSDKQSKKTGKKKQGETKEIISVAIKRGNKTPNNVKNPPNSN